MGDFAAQLMQALRYELPDPTAEEEDAVLELARIVAHATERRNAPLACYIAGMYVGAHSLTGAERGAALARALDAARVMVGEIR
jgi:hypothetical protein